MTTQEDFLLSQFNRLLKNAGSDITTETQRVADTPVLVFRSSAGGYVDHLYWIGPNANGVSQWVLANGQNADVINASWHVPHRGNTIILHDAVPRLAEHKAVREWRGR